MILNIQPEVNDIQSWCLANRLKLNVSKSKVLVLASRHKLRQFDYSEKIILGNQSLQFPDKYRYLGVTLYCEMNLTALLSDVRKSVSNRLFNFRKTQTLYH